MALVVLNSFHFWDDISPSIAQELQGGQPDNQLYQALKAGSHQILITNRGERRSILNEYAREARTQGVEQQLRTLIDQLELMGLLTVRELPRQSIRNLRAEHSIFFEDAVAAGVPYLVTEYAPWLRLSRDRRLCPNLEVVNAGRFIRLSNRNSRSRNRP